ncbi:AfsR/SARP family transcriptional regulator [Georgenia sp. Marseille-Q6866]
MDDTADCPRWQLHLLDRWQLLAPDEGPVDVPQREQRLLSLLAVRGPRRRDYLAGVLWPESDEARARANLRGALWWLHHRVGSVVTDGAGCLVLGPAVDVDLHGLRTYLGPRVGTVPVSPAVVDALSFDDLLPGWAEPWVLEERHLLHQLRLQALEASVDLALGAGDTATALLAATRAVGLDPFRESARRALVRVHVQEGNYADAVAVYDTFADLLHRELGIRVSDELQRLVRPLLWSAVSPD